MVRIGCTALLALALCAGCVRLPLRTESVDPAEVEALEPRPFTVDRGALGLKLRLHNPHDTQGTLRGVVWELWLEGRWFASGTQEVRGMLAGAGSRELELELPLVFE